MSESLLREASQYPRNSIWETLHYEFTPPHPGAQPLECRSGQTEALRKVSSLPLDWTTGWQTCKIGEGCQETVLLLLNGECPAPTHHLTTSRPPRAPRHERHPSTTPLIPTLRLPLSFQDPICTWCSPKVAQRTKTTSPESPGTGQAPASPSSLIPTCAATGTSAMTCPPPMLSGSHHLPQVLGAGSQE